MILTEEQERIKEFFKEVSVYAGDCDDWVEIKKEVMKYLSAPVKSNFSRRHPVTKNHTLNQFEEEMINYYKELTGILLVVRTLEERRTLYGKLHR